MERAQSRLREELERERGGGGRAQEQLQEGRAQADQLRGQLERVTSELSSLQEENRSLRSGPTANSTPHHLFTSEEDGCSHGTS